MESARTSAFKIVSSANIDECRAAVGTIRQKNVIALYSTDAYIDWPLKLLAVGTGDGNVYLFDIFKNGNEQDRGLFKNSGLDEVLTSPEIVKVIHACNNISAALFFQFGIKMSNVFDVQVAHNIIREHKGKAGIGSTNLKNICNIYLQNRGTYKQTYFRLLQWGKKEGDFWTKRPLAQEKIDYACNEVSALIPELYEQQKRYLEDNGLTDGFNERVQEETDCQIDPVQKVRKDRRISDQKKHVLANIVNMSKKGMKRYVLSNEDMGIVLNNMSIEEIKSADDSDVLLELKFMRLEQFLDTVEQQMKNPNTFYPRNGLHFNISDAGRRYELRNWAERLKKQFMTIFANDIQEKYGSDAQLSDLSRHDMKLIEALRPLTDGWAYPQILLGYYWRCVEDYIDEDILNLSSDQEYEVRKIEQLLIFQRDLRAPASIKTKVNNIIDVVIERLPQKFKSDSCVNDLSKAETTIIQRLDVMNKAYDPFVVGLHWEVVYALICDEIKVFSERRMKTWLSEMVNFLSIDDRVPARIKQKAKEYQSTVEKWRKENVTQ